MQIVIDKSYLQGVATETIRRLSKEHTVLFTETLLYELLTTTESIRRACFAKLPARENPVAMIPCVGLLLRYEIEHQQAASPLIEHRLPFTFEFNPQLSTGIFCHPPNEEKTLVRWRQEVKHEVETFHPVVTEVAVWCPQLRDLSGDVLRTACEDLKRQAGTDADVVRNIYQSLEGLDGFPPASVLDSSWVLFRWVQVHLLFALDYVSRYGFSDPAEIPKRVEHDLHDIQYVIYGALCGALATRNGDIACNFTLACPEGTLF